MATNTVPVRYPACAFDVCYFDMRSDLSPSSLAIALVASSACAHRIIPGKRMLCAKALAATEHRGKTT